MKKRHEEILRIISEEEIMTQEELAARLRERGFDAAQATISRDIKTLSLVKMTAPDGKLIYRSLLKDDTEMPEKLIPVFRHAFVFLRSRRKSHCHKNSFGNGQRTRVSRRLHAVSGYIGVRCRGRRRSYRMQDRESRSRDLSRTFETCRKEKLIFNFVRKEPSQCLKRSG